jgi:hypothetical protein
VAMSSVELISRRFANLQQDNPPDVLYHYTDRAGLLGILKTGELWATKIQYMNDSTEFSYCLSLTKSLLDDRLSNSRSHEDRQILDWVLRHLEAITFVNVCSVSFCRDPDLLSQWRGYSGSGAGYSIGFLSKELSSFHNNLHHCIYDRTDQAQIINEIIDEMLQKKSHINSEDDPKLVLGAAFERSLIQHGAFFKDTSFAEENEWRLAVGICRFNDPKFGVRPGKSMLIPFYVLQLRTMAGTTKSMTL